MNKTLLLIHGRSWKPPEESLRSLWLDALRWGLDRDFPDAAARFSEVTLEFVYYGDTSNCYMESAEGKPYVDDTDSRRHTLELLKVYSSNQFSKRNYNRLPGKESFKEGAADVLSPILSFFNLSETLIAAVAPDMREYWNDESFYGTEVRRPMIKPLKRALDREGSTAIVAHSLGTIIAYDTLWKFSRYGEWYDYWNRKIDLFVTLGCPLGDATVRENIKGYNACKERRYPANIREWVNIAAEDDYISHDSKISDDYRTMRQYGLVESIKDYKIYNLSLRGGKSNPHHSGGYLIHPRTVKILAEWILE
ncbi:hypothetical protein [Prosthecochloris sp.]|uniref:hypothetical protein n=1 Tax=Prosthecochloris sp. TaxID=290513 RepID=UPI0025FAE58D|nr:hypothetical protein [Prosthecochloris sp.]